MPHLSFQYSFVQNFLALNTTPFLKVIQFLELILSLVSLDYLKIRLFIITLSYCLNSIFYSCKPKSAIPTRVLLKVKAVF